MHKVVLLIGLVCLVSFSAAAQDKSTMDLFAGYSYIHANPVGTPSYNANGGIASAAFNLNNFLGVVGEIGSYHAGMISNLGVNANAQTYMIGPKVSLFKISKLSPFVQGLGGIVQANSVFAGSTGTTTRLAMAVGAGLDYNWHPHIAIRLAQADYFLTRFPSNLSNISTQSNFRYSAGVVLRF
jgi:opacity protein-like surface antigen